MADVILSNTPSKYNLSYGYNVFSFYDNDQDPYRYFCQVYNTSDVKVADVRQLPNQAGYGHFDIQNILKNFTTPSPSIEETLRLKSSPDEVFEFNIQYGMFDGVTFTGTGVTNNYIVFNGRKPSNELEWDYEDYIARGYNNPFGGVDNLVITEFSEPLTDIPYDFSVGSLITDGKPSWVGNNNEVYSTTIFPNQDYTLSFINDVEALGGQTLPTYTNGINGFYIAVYNGNTQVLDTIIYNTTGNGGGPDVNLGDEIQPTDGYRVVSIQMGQRNPLLNGLTYTHVYIKGFAWYNGYSENQDKVDITDVFRVNIDDGQCNDFEPIEVSWLNSFGFRDYFVFQKRKNRNISVQRNTYQKVNSSWNSDIFQVEQYNRGESVYSQTIEDNYELNTRYLTDSEAEWLKNLYISPDVRIRFVGDTQWTPVVLLSDRWDERTYRKDRLFQYTLSLKTSNKINSQRGI